MFLLTNILLLPTYMDASSKKHLSENTKNTQITKFIYQNYNLNYNHRLQID